MGRLLADQTIAGRKESFDPELLTTIEHGLILQNRLDRSRNIVLIQFKSEVLTTIQSPSILLFEGETSAMFGPTFLYSEGQIRAGIMDAEAASRGWSLVVGSQIPSSLSPSRLS